MILLLLIVLVVFILGIFALSLLIAFFFGPPFLATPLSIINEMFALVPLQKTDLVLDLGCGDGRILIAAAKWGAKAKGFEINPFFVLWTRLIAKSAGVSKNVRVFCQPYQTADIQDGTVIFLYNIRSALPSLERKLHNECKPGTKILSYIFPLRSLKPIKQTPSGLFMYIIPARH